jgi:DNA-binding CsgD family transcriptional regulator
MTEEPTVATAVAIQPLATECSEEATADLQERITTTRWPEEATVDDAFVAAASAPIHHPITGQVLGILAFVCSAEAANQLLLPLVCLVVQEVEQRLVNGPTQIDRIVRAKFLEARRRTRGPVAAVSQVAILTNAAAAPLFPATDRSRLWDFVSRKLSTSEAIKSRFTLADGNTVRVCLEAILDGGAVVGAMVRLAASSHEAPVIASSRSAVTRARRPKFGWDSLTEAEHSVTELVADGLTNREAAARLFLSRHTIDSHLRHIFRKLDINSRVDLVRIATARNMADRSHLGAVGAA